MSSSSHSHASSFPLPLTQISPSEPESSPRLTKPRAKPLGRTVRPSSVLFGRVLDERDKTNGQVARAWGVDERVVRDVRAGRKPLTVERLMASPRSVREAILHLLLAMSEAPPVIDADFSLEEP